MRIWAVFRPASRTRISRSRLSFRRRIVCIRRRRPFAEVRNRGCVGFAQHIVHASPAFYVAGNPSSTRVCHQGGARGRSAAAQGLSQCALPLENDFVIIDGSAVSVPPCRRTTDRGHQLLAMAHARDRMNDLPGDRGPEEILAALRAGSGVSDAPDLAQLHRDGARG